MLNKPKDIDIDFYQNTICLLRNPWAAMGCMGCMGCNVVALLDYFWLTINMFRKMSGKMGNMNKKQ